MTPLAMGLKQAEQATGISVDQLRDACKRGDLPSRKNGTRYVIKTTDRRMTPTQFRRQLAASIAVIVLTFGMVWAGDWYGQTIHTTTTQEP